MSSTDDPYVRAMLIPNTAVRAATPIASVGHHEVPRDALPTTAGGRRRSLLGAHLRTRVSLACLCLLWVAGCARQLPLALPANTPVQVTEIGGAHYTLEPSSDAYDKLALWVSNNRSRWSWGHYYATPPGRGIIVRCGTLQLQFLDSKVLAHMPEGDYIKSVSPTEYAFLGRSATDR